MPSCTLPSKICCPCLVCKGTWKYLPKAQLTEGSSWKADAVKCDMWISLKSCLKMSSLLISSTVGFTIKRSSLFK